MAACESQVTAVLDALRGVNQLLMAKAAELRENPQWSEVTYELTFLGGALDIWGCVDAELDPIGGVAWHVNIRRDGEGWETQRDMTLNPNDHPDRSQRVVAELPLIRSASSPDLAATLPEAVGELLALAVPDADPDGTPQAS